MHIFPVTLEIDGYPASLIVAQFSNEQSIESLFEAIYNGFPDERMQAAAIILRPDVRDQFSAVALTSACNGEVMGSSVFLNAIAEASANQVAHFGRFESLPIYILHTEDFVPVLSGNINPRSSVLELIEDRLALSETVDEIRDTEMRFLVEKSRAFLPPIDGTYYLAPSNKPVRSFLRVGNLQYSRQSIDAITFWLLPYLKQSRAILVDTWSLSSIAMNASRVLAILRGEPPVPVEMLSQYQDSAQDRQAALIETLDRLVHDANLYDPERANQGSETDGVSEQHSSLPVTCLVSATQTGSLVAVLKDQMELSGLDIEFAIVALFSLGETTDQLPSLCDMSNDPDFAKLGDNEAEDLSPIAVDPQVYFPLRYLNVEITPLAGNADPFRPFLDLVLGKDIISVHRDQVSDGSMRHHAIHVDMERLFALPEFVEQFEAKLIALDPTPSVILRPLHPAADILAQLAADILKNAKGSDTKIVGHTSLELRVAGPTAEHDAGVRAALLGVPATSAILILDDCYITGARMTGYQTRLRQLAVPARLHYLVGLARPSNGQVWELFKRRVSYRAPQDRCHHHNNSVDAVLSVCLPNWQSANCPWCQEANFYEQCSQDGDDGALPPPIAERQAILADRDAGLKENLFFVRSGLGQLKLFSGSVFAPEASNQAEVFAAAAAALQHLRIEGVAPRLGPRRYPIATVIKRDAYLHDMFTDSILRASILRGASAEELVYTDGEQEEQRTEQITTILTSENDDVNDIDIELILANALHKCSLDHAIDVSSWPDELRKLLEYSRKAATRR